MSSRVEADNRARQNQEQRLQERLGDKKSQENAKTFSQTMKRKKTTDEKESQRSHLQTNARGPKDGAQKALLARSGIQAGKNFQSMLQHSGQKSLKKK